MSAMLDRGDVVAKMLADRRGDLLVVCGLGSPSFDVVSQGDNPRNFYLWGAMGQAVPVGLGIAIARPDARVLVITGDGELLMGVGSLSTVGDKMPENLAILVLDNGQYAETGGQRTHTAGKTDLAGVAANMGFSETLTIIKVGDVEAARASLLNRPGPILVVAKVAPLKYGPPPEAQIRFGHHVAGRFRMAVTGRGDAALDR